MAITRAQQFKQMLAQGGRIGLRRGGPGGSTGQASQSESPSFGGRNETTGRNPMAQFGPPRTQNIVDEVALTGGRTLTKEARDRLEDQRRQATYQITPSTKPINRAIANALGVTTPFGLGRFLFNKAVDRTAMGFNTPTFNEEDEDVGGDEQNRQIMLAGRFTPYQQDIIEDKAEELSPIELAIQQRNLMGGPRAFAAEGGIMDLETGRQMYFLGKLVKKAKKAVKKIVSSPVGKTALAAAGIFKLGGGSFTDLLARRDSGFDLDNIPFLPEDSKDRFGVAAATGLLAAPFIFGKDDTEDEYQKFLAQRNAGKTFNIPGTRAKPDDTLARAFVAEGGKPEPVAKKTMPLLDMGGKEMDLRAEGGFVPIGRMEKADDVPARLSKNEFVFTADAVRNAGDGNVDKGAEVMYNMMKNLESGGEVSEESQGLEGARNMFQTSQRLEEVL